MAGITTANKRRSAINLAPYTIPPTPGSKVNVYYRKQAAYIYYGPVLLYSYTKTLNIDVILTAVYARSKELTVDGILKIQKSLSVTTDSIFKKSRTKSVGLDAYLMLISTFNIGSNKRRSAWNVAPYVIAPIPDGSINARDRRQAAYLYSGILAKLVAAEYSRLIRIDSVLREAGKTRQAVVDAILTISRSMALDIDSILHILRSSDIDLDAVLAAAGKGKITLLDSILRTAKSFDFDLDARIIKIRELELAIDAYLNILRTQDLEADAILHSLQTKDLDIDGILRASKSGNVDLDTFLTKLRSLVLPVDARFIKSYARLCYLDALLGGVCSRILQLDSVLIDIGASSAWLKVFPIGYIGDNNAYSKGSYIEDDLYVNNVLKEPDSVVDSLVHGHSAFSNISARPVSGRKVWDHRHVIVYNYDNIYQSDYRTIKEFIKRVSKQSNESFYLIDFGQGQKVTGFSSSGSNFNASVSNTYPFSDVEGEGGHYICIRNGETGQFRIGKITSIADNSSVTFSDSNDYGSLSTYTAHKTLAYPVYRVHLDSDQEKFDVIGYTNEYITASEAGPLRKGTIRFIQKDTR